MSDEQDYQDYLDYQKYQQAQTGGGGGSSLGGRNGPDTEPPGFTSQFLKDVGTASGPFLDRGVNMWPAAKASAANLWEAAKMAPGMIGDELKEAISPQWETSAPHSNLEDAPTNIAGWQVPGSAEAKKFLMTAPRGLEGAKNLLGNLVLAAPRGAGNAYVESQVNDAPPEEQDSMRRRIKAGAFTSGAASLIPGSLPAKAAWSFLGGVAGDEVAKRTDDIPDPPMTKDETLKEIGGKTGDFVFSLGKNNAMGHAGRRIIKGFEGRLGATERYAKDSTDSNTLIASALTSKRDDAMIRNSDSNANFHLEGKNMPLSEALKEHFPDINEVDGIKAYYPKGSHMNPLREHIGRREDRIGQDIADVYKILPKETDITYGDVLKTSSEGGVNSQGQPNKISAEQIPHIRTYNKEILPVAKRVLSKNDYEKFHEIHERRTLNESTNDTSLSPTKFSPQEIADYESLTKQIFDAKIPTEDLWEINKGFGKNANYSHLASDNDQKNAGAYQLLNKTLVQQRNKWVKSVSPEEFAHFQKLNKQYAVVAHARQLADDQIMFEENNPGHRTSSPMKDKVGRAFGLVTGKYPKLTVPDEMITRALPSTDPRSDAVPGLQAAGQIASLGRKAMYLPTEASPLLTNPMVLGQAATQSAQYNSENPNPIEDLVRKITGAGNFIASHIPGVSDAGAQNPEMPIGPTSPTGNSNFNSLEAGSFDTPLDPQQQQGYEQWKSTLPPRLQWTGDYDLQGFYKDNGPVPFSGDMHMPDTYKKPNHPTFSNESQYAPMGNPGSWNGNTFMPPAPPNFAEQPFRRDVSFVTQNRQAFIERVAMLGGGNPQLLKDVSTVLTNPNQNQKETALAQLAVNLPELFVTARYPSEMNGKLYDPVDKDEFEKEITTQKTNGQVDPIFWAKQVSALNVDGRILQQEQPPMGPQSPFSSPPPRVETPVGSRRSYDY